MRKGESAELGKDSRFGSLNPLQRGRDPLGKAATNGVGSMIDKPWW